ncbi:S41 family peptidase [Piscinibacter sakaiensis]|uniref:PDZ domain-containing protein n=1 Tax=Piscinibacter sakaiensis TaxID=1547922 RepID=A0A0K8P8H9_PISS1|nr:S41 family peptidase [Piscinibacter sakaiensis]GAP38958.1 hypothetical protein ISF6_0377 [Piscinibacter sakaiensis]
MSGAPSCRRGTARRAAALAAACAAVGLAACGGGGGGDPAPAPPAAAAACDLASQKAWLRDDMAQRYLWNTLSPSPDPAPYGSLPSYFGALLFTGGGGIPADRWSYLSDSAAYDQFFAEGRTLGYGVAVNGAEGRPPLRVRYVEARSPAGVAGLRRGERIVSVNGRSGDELLRLGDFAALSPAREGDSVTLELEPEAGGTRRTVVLRAATFDLTPVPVVGTLPGPGGRPVGYLLMKDFITQAEEPLRTGLAQLRAAGATELVLDLRYNGGGRVSTANVLGSLIVGAERNGQVFTELRYNARLAAQNTRFTFEASTPGFQRVVVLTGPRTCSASELVVNGLAPYLPVATIGGATCGKPYGFNPTPNCGTTVSAVNFESVNAAGVGRYHDGLPATCSVDDTATGSFGQPDEALTAGALGWLATGRCSAAAAAPRDKAAAAVAATALRRGVVDGPGERPPGMWADRPAPR